MQYTHYYEELGLKPTDFPFEDFEDEYKRNIPDKEGFTELEFFNLDLSLALYIYGRLRYFEDNCMAGTPAGLTEKKWKKTINKMIRAFAFYCIYDNLPEDTKSGALKAIKTGMNAFIKYFGELWV